MTEVAGVDPTVLRDRLFDLWSHKQPEALRVLAQQGFSELAEPLEGLLSLLEGCPGKQKGKTSTLGHLVLLEFLQWRKAHPQVTLEALPEHQVLALQRRALGLLTDAQPTFMDPLLDIYRLGSLDLSVLRLHIVRLQTLNCYREASLMSMKLSLQEELDMEEMCVPLILQDKLSMAETYVKGRPHLEERLVKLLDSWCHPSFTVGEISRQFPRLTLSKHCADQIHPKMLIKHVFRLVEKFNLDPGLCPNSMYKRRLDSLRFLMYKRFVEKGMSQENWSDHVQSTVANCPELQIQLVELLVKHCGLQSASQWSLRYNIPRDRLPFGVWDTQQSLPPAQKQVCTNNCETWDPPPSHQNRFYQLPIARDRVHFVDMPEALQQCKQAVLQPGSVVGLDMEWRAGFGSVSAQRVALIQLAVEGQVFLLDLCASGFCQHPDTMRFLRTLFSDSKVLKLGYGMAGDLKCLLTTWPEFSQEPLKFEGMMDLLNVHQQIQRSGCRRGPREVLVGNGPAEKGLSLLVQQVLGRPLDKMEQLSNWERRPLRINQMRYAAVDAYCLLNVYATLSNDPASFGLPADLRSIKPVQSERSKEDKKQKEKAKQARRRQEQQEAGGPGCSPAPDKGTLTGEVACLGPPMVPQQLRVVCDNMLQGLGRYLRCLGVDVVLLENTDNHRVAAQLAQAEGRVILTCGQPYQTLKSQVGEGRCLSLDCSEKARDQAVRVLKHFNVQPTPADIFSRCQVCNSDQYMRLTRADMSRMLRERGFLQDLKVNHLQTDPLVEEQQLPDPPRYAPQCRWAPPSALDPVTLTFPGGASLQLHTVPPGLLPRIPLFFVCTSCGKVFWEGSHFGRVMAQFQEVLKITEEDIPGTACVAQKN